MSLPPKYGKSFSRNKRNKRVVLLKKIRLYYFYHVNKEFEKRGRVSRNQIIVKKVKKDSIKEKRVEIERHLFTEQPY